VKVGSVVSLSTGTNNTHPRCCAGSGDLLVDNEVKDDLHPSGMSLFDQPVAVFQRAVFGVDILIIGDVVSLMRVKQAKEISQREEASHQG
jgi:hypothetical protein